MAGEGKKTTAERVAALVNDTPAPKSIGFANLRARELFYASPCEARNLSLSLSRFLENEISMKCSDQASSSRLVTDSVIPSRTSRMSCPSKTIAKIGCTYHFNNLLSTI